MIDTKNRTRRAFFRAATVGGTGVGLCVLQSGLGSGLVREAKAAENNDYPRLRLGLAADLKVAQAVRFHYPDASHTALLIKLGHEARDGVGPDRDIVAYSTVCPHMGCDISDRYDKGHPKVLGPCRCHFSSFDLSKAGVQIQGQATEALPQVLLELQNGELFAYGVRGLIYGRAGNLLS